MGAALQAKVARVRLDTRELAKGRSSKGKASGRFGDWETSATWRDSGKGSSKGKRREEKGKGKGKSESARPWRAASPPRRFGSSLPGRTASTLASSRFSASAKPWKTQIPPPKSARYSAPVAARSYDSHPRGGAIGFGGSRAGSRP